MSMSKNIARLAVTAGLTAALSFGGVMAPVTMAFAEGDNTITITQADKNGTTKFKAYQIFKAKVVDQNESKVASDIKWANDETEKAVIGVLKQVAAPNINDSSTAEDVADYLAQNVRDTTDKTCVKNTTCSTRSRTPWPRIPPRRALLSMPAQPLPLRTTATTSL